MRVLVTGGAGFIGSHVAERLVAAGHGVRVLDALLPAVHAAPPSLPAEVELVVGDVRDAATVAAALSDVDAVSHQAAMVGLGVDLDDLPAYAGCNDLGTAVLLAGTARAGIRRLVLASSMVVYGEGRYRCREHGDVAPGPRRVPDLDAGRFEPPCPVCGAPLDPDLVGEDARLDPRNVYAATKVAQEHLAASWARVTGGTVAALRYHNVYGARMPQNTPYAGVASLFRSALARGEAPRVFEDGGQRRDFVDVRDVAAANLAALSTVDAVRAGTLRAFNVGSGQPHTVGEMAAVLAAASGGKPPAVTGDYRLGDVRHVTASSARAADELGWSAGIDFEAGMTEFATAPLRTAVG
ncbi:MAG TPA: NAD-dependent epimerase/dehydratase family protein [Mycobacteriales bacterium]|nr:NAD-dependent epimerase/dehydratase family protein [Mycobacteriales bacterium]